MTTLFDCLQEVIAKGPRFIVRSSAAASGQAVTEWEPSALLDDMRQTSPAVLDDPAWTEWSVRPRIGASSFIHYGVRGYSLSHMEVPGYGNLQARELDQNKQMSADEDARGAPDSLSRLLGC